MNVRYQIIVEVTADGMLGPLKVQEAIQLALKEYRIGITQTTLDQRGLTIGNIRIAAVYPVAHNDEKTMVDRVPGHDQSRQVENIRDERIT